MTGREGAQTIADKPALDAIFSYQLPFNLVAVVSLFPLSFVLSPRW